MTDGQYRPDQPQPTNATTTAVDRLSRRTVLGGARIADRIQRRTSPTESSPLTARPMDIRSATEESTARVTRHAPSQLPIDLHP